MTAAPNRLHAKSACIAVNDEFFRLALQSILTDRLGVRAGGYLAGGDATDRALHGPVDLLVAELPDDPDAACTQLHTLRDAHPDAALVAVVARASRRQMLRLLDTGIQGVVPRSFGVDAMARALRLVLEGVIFVPPADAGAEAAAALPVPAEDDVAQRLTPRQWDVLGLLMQGRSNKEIARKLDLGEGTVKCHLAALLRNLGVQNRSAAAVAGARMIAAGAGPHRPVPGRHTPHAAPRLVGAAPPGAYSAPGMAG